MSDLTINKDSASSAESFVIFSIPHILLSDEFWSEYDEAAAYWLEELAMKHGAKRITGYWEGEQEQSYIVNAKTYYSTLRAPLNEIGEKTVLVLGPQYRFGYRPAVLEYVAQDRAPENYGYFRSVTAETGKAHAAKGGASYDGATDTWYICEHMVQEPILPRAVAS